MDTLSRLAAIEAIKQLKSQYFAAFDLKHWDSLASLFSEDAVIDFSQQPEVLEHFPEADLQDWIFVGGRALADFNKMAYSEVKSAHHGHDPQIVITGDNTATGQWALSDRIESADEIFQGHGHYRDEYRRIDGEWKITELVLTRVMVTWDPRSPH